jgi:hypothetical protein
MSEAAYIINPNLDVKLISSKTEILTHNATNPMPGKTNTSYEIRDVSQRLHYYNHVLNGIFEQQFTIMNELDAEIKVTIATTFDAGAGYKTGATLWSGNIPVGGRWFFTSDKTTAVDERIVPLVELRLPYPGFIIYINGITIPTTGGITIQNVRRY